MRSRLSGLGWLSLITRHLSHHRHRVERRHERKRQVLQLVVLRLR